MVDVKRKPVRVYSINIYRVCVKFISVAVEHSHVFVFRYLTGDRILHAVFGGRLNNWQEDVAILVW